ncbi:MAG: iron ABC transporter permease [SAR324 cluster bacterium]|nr:iron ABC transporter permease [SAR324 cluster bacterium]
MTIQPRFLIRRIAILSVLLLLLLAAVMILGISTGSSGSNLASLYQLCMNWEDADPVLKAIVWRIRLPRVLLAVQAGAALSLGGLVFQAILRNPLAEPYILGISGGSAVGAILGILAGMAYFPGVGLMAFAGSIITLLIIFFISMGQTTVKKDSLLLSGVMVNAFCSSVIMFFISMTHDSRLQNILFWIMGDFSLADMQQVLVLFVFLVPCFLLIFWLSHTMNLLLMGKEMALTMGVNVKMITIALLLTTSFMVSAIVAYSGLVGFVGLVIPHLLRLLFGSDHRLLVPACILGGGTYMVLCDLLARSLPEQGEMPIGVITAFIGAPLFIFLLRKTRQ